MRMGRDRGTAARASRDTLSAGEVSPHTSPRFAEEPAWGHCSLLAGRSNTSSELCLARDSSGSSRIPRGSGAPFQWQTRFEGSGACLSQHGGNDPPASGRTSLKQIFSPAFSPPVSLKLREQHPPTCTRWLRQQQQPNVRGDELPEHLLCFCGELAAGRGCPGWGSSLGASLQGFGGNPPSPPQSPSHTPALGSQRHLDSLPCARNAIPHPAAPIPWQGEAVSLPWSVPGTNPSTASHPASLGFSKCLQAVVLAFLS